MELKATNHAEVAGVDQQMDDDLWPLDAVDAKKARFPEDGVVLDFAGSNFVNVDNFAYGSVARYLQLHRGRCCFPPNLGGHTCKHGYRHSEHGTAMSWDDALRLSMSHFQHKSYNLFTCNCYSYVANCLNRLSYSGSMGWNVINVSALILVKGQWVDSMSIVRSFFPFVAVTCLGMGMVGWAFLVGLASFSLLLIGWFLLGTYCSKTLVECD
ncbi:Protein REVERSION-TO-ETHYLENE SENSITIVITY1-like [Asimina triloba]